MATATVNWRQILISMGDFKKHSLAEPPRMLPMAATVAAIAEATVAVATGLLAAVPSNGHFTFRKILTPLLATALAACMG